MIPLKMKFPLTLTAMLFLLASLAFLPGCKVGDDDPGISFRSRDARLKANWKMRSMQNVVEINNQVAGGVATRTQILSDFDGYNIRIKTFVNSLQVSDSSFGFNYQMMLKDNGKVGYENTVIIFSLGTKSAGDDNWYWINTDQKKARVYLGSALQYAATVGVPMQTNISLPFSTLLTDFTVEGLRNRELKLSYQKNTSQVTLAGFQQVSISSKFVFDSK